jgi:8-oxo-dGTP diphosphatase
VPPPSSPNPDSLLASHDAAHTRDWAKWDAEHPYIHHPRHKKTEFTDLAKQREAADPEAKATYEGEKWAVDRSGADPNPSLSNKEAGDLASKIVGEKVRIMPTDRFGKHALAAWKNGTPRIYKPAEPQALKSDIVHESAHLLVSKAKGGEQSGHGADFRSTYVDLTKQHIGELEGNKLNHGFRLQKLAMGTSHAAPHAEATVLSQLEKAVNATDEADAGATIHQHTGVQPTHGIAVSEQGHSHIAYIRSLKDNPAAQKAFIDDFLWAERASFDDPEKHIGVWHDLEDDELVLDPVDMIEDRDEAVQAGKDRNQQGVFDLGSMEYIDTGGTGDRDSATYWNPPPTPSTLSPGNRHDQEAHHSRTTDPTQEAQRNESRGSVSVRVGPGGQRHLREGAGTVLGSRSDARGVVDSVAAHTRDWAKWDAEHPYVPHESSFFDKVKSSFSWHKDKITSSSSKPPPKPHVPPAPPERLGGYDKIDMHAEGGAWGPIPKGANVRYGAVTFDARGRVLLREPSNHYLGYAWTFPKGGPDKGERPEQTALRETTEETGFQPTITGHLPGAFGGQNYESPSHNHFFLAEDQGMPQDTKAMDANGETWNTKWVEPTEALNLIAQSDNLPGRYRDFQILKSAYESYDAAHPGHHFPTINLPPPPPPPPKWHGKQTFDPDEPDPIHYSKSFPQSMGKKGSVPLGAPGSQFANFENILNANKAKKAVGQKQGIGGGWS